MKNLRCPKCNAKYEDRTELIPQDKGSMVVYRCPNRTGVLKTKCKGKVTSRHRH